MYTQFLPFPCIFFLFPRTAQFSRTPVTVNANWLTNGSHQSNRLAMFVLLIRETTKRTGFFDCFSLRFASHSLCSPLLSSLPCAFHTFPSVYFHLSFPINTPLSDSCNSPSAGRRLKGLNSFSFIAFFFLLSSPLSCTDRKFFNSTTVLGTDSPDLPLVAVWQKDPIKSTPFLLD